MTAELTEELHTWMVSGRIASVYYAHRCWLGPLHRANLPFKVIWGRVDPIAVYAIAQKLCIQNQHISLQVLDDIGHYPQLEAADLVASCLLDQAPDLN